ncbi:MAG TPA: PQQ-binding-like beta-propeller repeat protein [Bryobacteraceae bacterium]|nr:PQQ-binding-like beta-propeller repeat protein [Bryobacteraceae bacterium]
MRKLTFPALFLSIVLEAAADTANSQSIFYARDFLFTLPFRAGLDIDPSYVPMAVSGASIYVAATFQSSYSPAFQGLLRRYDLAGNEIWTRQITAADTAFPQALAAGNAAIYVAGSAGQSRTELFLNKYDEQGNQLWARQFQISDGGYHMLAGIATDSSGLYLAASDGSAGILRKYSPQGDEIWTRTMTVHSLRGLTIADGIYVSGLDESAGFVSKYASDGAQLWTHQLSSSPSKIVVPAALGSDSAEVFAGGAVFQRAGEGTTFAPDSGEAVVYKLDANGNELWTRRFGEAGANGVTGLSVDSTGVYLAGTGQGALPGQCNAGFQDVFARKYDADGNEQWTRQFGTAHSDFASSVALDSTGVYLSGSVRGGAAAGSAFVVKLGKSQTISTGSHPEIAWECVVNAADYAGGGVAPGEVVTIFGKGMGPDQLTLSPPPVDGQVASMIAGARILFNGVPAPLLYVSDTQSAAVVPYGVADYNTVNIELEYQEVRSESLTLPVSNARPGIFSLDSSGRGQGAILNEDGSLNSPANSAPLGSIITLFVTGAGSMEPAVADGAILDQPIPKPKLPVSVLFEDPSEPGSISPAEVVSAEGAPGSVAGVIQVKVRLPSWIKPGLMTPIYVEVGSESAEPGVTVAIR